MIALLRFGRFTNFPKYFWLAVSSFKKPWRRALFLDLLLGDIHLTKNKIKNPSLSMLFLNAAAHIQHHYLLSSSHCSSKGDTNPSWYVNRSSDPFKEMLEIYNRILAPYVETAERTEREVLVATGLSQMPYDRVKYYYRLDDHHNFLKLLGINFKGVQPLMTRDFVINFANAGEASLAQKILEGVVEKESSKKIFGSFDNRGDSLFVTLSFDQEISSSSEIISEGSTFNLLNLVNFVAIKNGMHCALGYVYATSTVGNLLPSNNAHIRCLNKTIISYFKEPIASAEYVKK